MRGNAVRALLPALVVLGLVGIVAVAATGSTKTGTGDSRRPADSLLDIVVSLGVVGVVVGGVFFVYALTQRQLMAREFARQKGGRTAFTAFTAFMALVVVAAYYRFKDWEQVQPVDEIGERAFPNQPPPEAVPGAGGTDYEPAFAWLPVAMVVALAVLGIVALLVAERRRRGPGRPTEDLAERIADVLDDTLDDLRAEADARRAIVAAYARLERTLAAHGVPRDPALTPQEYVGTVLGGLAVEEGAVRRLTALFAEAKFSQHEIGAAMKDEAIDALVTVRDDLRRRAAEASEPRPALAPTGHPA